jgi:hypothetical protein
MIVRFNVADSALGQRGLLYWWRGRGTANEIEWNKVKGAVDTRGGTALTSGDAPIYFVKK